MNLLSETLHASPARMSQETALRRLAERVRSPLEPAKFIAAVVEAYRAARDEQPGPGGANFQGSRSEQVFRRALQQVRDHRPRPTAVLVLTSGKGLVPLASRFAMAEVQEMLGADGTVAITVASVTPQEIVIEASDAESFDGIDLIVTHSLLHFLHSHEHVLACVNECLQPGGAWLVAHEPNSRFWRNAACLTVLDERRMWQQRGKAVWSPRQLFRWALYLGRRQPSFHERVNGILQSEFGFHGDLTPAEIDRVVDPHRPKETREAMGLGSEGIDWEALASRLPECDMEWVETYDHLGYTAEAALPVEWQRRSMELCSAFPLDGAVFTCLWRKRASAAADNRISTEPHC